MKSFNIGDTFFRNNQIRIITHLKNGCYHISGINERGRKYTVNYIYPYNLNKLFNEGFYTNYKSIKLKTENYEIY